MWVSVMGASESHFKEKDIEFFFVLRENELILKFKGT